MPNNTPGSYEFVCTSDQREQLKTWAEQAAMRGVEAEYAAALKTVYNQLTTAPLTWGDPCYRLSHLGLQVYQRACTPLYVAYAVDAVRRIVYVMKFTLLTGSGFV